MFRKLIPLAVAIVLVVGCKKKSESSADGTDPNATYTLKFRDPQQGDKCEITLQEANTVELTLGAKSDKLVTEKRAEYTDELNELPSGAASATKLTRTYKIAKRTDISTKQLKSTGLEGKTIVIEKKGSGHTYTSKGKSLDASEKMELDSEFRGEEPRGKLQELLPKAAVKVGESWTLPLSALKAMSANGTSGLDEAKSKLTCKLSRVYSQDGKQWGVIDFDFDLVGDHAAKGKDAGLESLKISGTIDGVIDGSARDMTLKATITGTGTSPGGKGPTAKLDGAIEKSLKTVK